VATTKPIPIRLNDKHQAMLELLVNDYNDYSINTVTRVDVLRTALEQLFYEQFADQADKLLKDKGL